MPTPRNAPYKVRNARFKARRNQVRRIETTSKDAGKKIWASDGQGYRVHKDGSLRRIDEPVPQGLLGRIRGVFRA